MTNDINHIDDFFKKKLENYDAGAAKQFLWSKLWIKLLMFNLGGWTLASAAVLFIATTGLLVYEFVNEGKGLLHTDPVSFKELDSQNGLSELKMKNFIHLNSAKEMSLTPLLNVPTELPEGIVNKGSGHQQKPMIRLIAEPETFTEQSMNSGSTKNTNVERIEKQRPSQLESIVGISFDQFDLNKYNSGKIKNRHQIIDSLKALNIKHRSIALEIYANPSIVTGFLSGQNLPVNYVENRNINENSLITIGAGIELKYRINNFYIQTGMNYSVYGENGNYNLSKTVEDPYNLVQRIDTVMVWIYDPPIINEQFIKSVDTIWIPGLKDIYWDQKSNNRINVLEIPVICGYEFMIKNFTVDIGTGVSLGFHISNKGEIPSLTNDELIGYEQLKVTEPQINYIFHAGLALPLNEQIKVFIKPNLKYSLTNFFDNEDYKVDQRYLSSGLKAGLIIDL